MKKFIYIGIIVVALVGLAFIVPPPHGFFGADKIPTELQLKTTKQNILYSWEYTDTDYRKDVNGKIILDENDKPIIEKQEQMISYSYKSDEIVPPMDNEIIEQRTPHIVYRNLGGDKRTAQSGYDFYKDGSDWKQIKSANTTKDAFEKQTVSFWDRFIAWATDTAATSPGTMADATGFGTTPWSNPNNAKVSDTNYATVACAFSASHLLKATNFGFAISDGATINGILVEVQVKSGSGMINDPDNTGNAIRLIKADATLGAESKGRYQAISTTESYVSYGASNDLWSDAWTSTDINDIDFGFAYAVTGNPVDTASVNHIRITITYTGGGAAAVEDPPQIIISD